MTTTHYSVGLLLAAEPVLLLLAVYLWRRQPSDHLRFLPFRRFVTLSAVACLTEIVYSLLVNNHYSMPGVFYQSLYALNLFIGLLATCSYYLYVMRFLTLSEAQMRVLRTLRYLVLLAMFVLLAANFATGHVARLNTVGRLLKGPLYDLASYCLPFYFLVVPFVLTLVQRNGLERRFLYAICGVSLFALAVYPVQMLFFPDVIAEYYILSLFAVVMFFLFETPPMSLLLETEERLRETYRQADEATRLAIQSAHAKNGFLSNMSNEIRTPINAIVGINDMILNEQNNAAVREYATEIRSAGNHLQQVINDILDYSRIESGDLDLRISGYSLSGLIAELYEKTLPLASAKGITLSFDTDRSLPDNLIGDAGRLSQAVMNLLSNAIKYTEHGSVKLTVNGVRRDMNLTLFFKVADTGIGMKKENLEKIFDSFSRVNIEQTRNILGTGLGLAITKDLVTMMDGDITVRSEVGAGSVFTIRIIQKILAETPGSAWMPQILPVPEKTEEKPLRFDRAKVLAVDGDPASLHVTDMLLKPYGIEADCVTSVSACLTACADNTYDMVLVRHRLPETDGVEILHTLLNSPLFDRERTKLVCLLTDDDPDEDAQFRITGFDDYLPAPVDTKKLGTVLRRYLEGRAAE